MGKGGCHKKRVSLIVSRYGTSKFLFPVIIFFQLFSMMKIPTVGENVRFKVGPNFYLIIQLIG